MSSKFKIGILAAFAIAATAIPLTITNSIAQEKAPVAQDQFQGQGGFQGGQGQGQGQPPQGGFRGQGGGQPGFPGGGQMMMGGGGGGGTAMVEEGLYLYVVQGNRVFKLAKQDLKVLATADLPRAMGGPQGGGPQGGGLPPAGGNRGGGGETK